MVGADRKYVSVCPKRAGQGERHEVLVCDLDCDEEVSGYAQSPQITL